MNWIGLATGIVFGVMTYAFGPGVRPFTLLDGNILTMMFLLTYGHLRHSNMWIAFTGVAGRILQSPAHHQLHHSTNPAHFDKNLGFALALWDWAFGTLVIPARTRESIVFGVGGEAPFRSTLAAFIVPCRRFAGHALRLVQKTRRCARQRPCCSNTALTAGSPRLQNLPILLSTPSIRRHFRAGRKSPRAGAACSSFFLPRSYRAWRPVARLLADLDVWR